MRHSGLRVVLAFAVTSLPTGLLAEVVVDTSLSLTKLQITASSFTVQVSGVTASAFTSVFDNLGGPCAATGTVTITVSECQGFDSETTTASANAAQGFVNASGGATVSPLIGTAAASSHINIPDGVADSAGTNDVSPYGDLSGLLEIVDSSNPTPTPISVTFSATLSGNQSLFSDAGGSAGTPSTPGSEAIFNFLVNGTSELFYDNPLSIGPSSMQMNPISRALMGNDSTLLTNTFYSFDAQVDAESFAMNTPEPSFFWPAGALSLLCLTRRFRRPDKFSTNA